MRGTHRVGSLLRLALSAAFLCVAWVVLSSSQADAAERPAPIVAPLVEQLDRSTVSAGDQAQVATASTVSHVGGALRALAAPLPVLGRPLSDGVDHVVAVVHDVPVVGRSPVVEVPLPDLPAAPMPPGIPGVAAPKPKSILVAERSASAFAPQRNSAATGEPESISRGLHQPALDAVEPPRGDQVGGRPDHPPSSSGSPSPSQSPERPSPPSAPMPPNNFAPNSSGGSSVGDLAYLGPAVVLPHSATCGSSSSDWQIPRAMPLRPGTRPD